MAEATPSQLIQISVSQQRIAGPLLIAGDFNTANMLWIQSVVPIPFFQSHTRAVRKAMEKIGFTTPFGNTGATFGFPPMKLDWIFLRGLRSLDRGLVELNFTDHNALWVVVEKAD